MDTLEERLTRLEETLYFQDRTIQELNEALTAQQFQLDEMHKLMQALQTKLRSLAPVLDTGGENTPPPHYGSV